MRVADYIAQFLAKNNVTDIFMLTGNGAMYLNDGIASEPSIKYYCARNEMTVPQMADGYARIKGSIGAACVTSGPGSANAVSGLIEPWVDSAPVIIISGQVPLRHTTAHTGLPLRTFGNAEINIIPIVKSITKYAAMVADPKTIRYHLEKAFHCAITGRPGPVWLDIPMDVQSATVDAENLEGYTPDHESLDTPSLEEKIAQCLALLRDAKRPLFVAGQGIRQGGAISEFKALLERTKIPVTFSRLGLDMLPFSHPQNMGLSGVKGTRYCGALLKGADLIIAVGARLSVTFVGNNFDAFSPEAKVVMVDIEEAELKKPGVMITLPIWGTAKSFLGGLVRALKGKPLPNWSAWLAQCGKLKADNPMVTPELQRNPIDLYYFMSRLDALSGHQHIFATDAGSNYYIGGQVYRFEHGQREVTSGAFAAMGLTIPLAIGASVAEKDAQILAVTGDGSLELNIQELKTMSYYNLNIKLFVINNGGYVSMRKWQDTFFEGRRIGSDDKTGIEALDLKKIADAFDLRYERIETYEEIDEKLKKIMKDDKPLFVEVICDNAQKIVEPIKDLSF